MKIPGLDLLSISKKLPAVEKPKEKLTFRTKLYWTALILVLYFLMGSVVVWGVNTSAIAQFEFLEIVFGSKFGSLITLGIGPIVTASIILQLLVGSKILGWDMKNPVDKKKFAGTQKILAIAFSLFEAGAYVMAGAIPPVDGGILFTGAVIMQLALGGIIIIFMDEVVSKWGIGSGISLFIAAGVAKTIFVRIFAPPIADTPGGILNAFIVSMSTGQPMQGLIGLLPIVSTIVVFVIVLYAQSMRIEIPMAFTFPFGRFAARRWPLKFIYTSNIPVILTAAVLANMQIIAKMMSQRGMTWLGIYDKTNGQPISGLMFYLTNPSTPSVILITVLAGILGLLFALAAVKYLKKWPLRMTIVGVMLGILLGILLINVYTLPVITATDAARSLCYVLFLVLGSAIFSVFWVNTAGMDAASVAEQFKASAISIPGFRRDPRIIERVLDRYIPAVTILGGVFVGILAGFADLTAALGTGTGILLTVMIVYQFYEQIYAQHWEEVPEPLRKILGD